MTQWQDDEGTQETLIADVRNRLLPTEWVDRRLRMMLGQAPLLDEDVSASFHGRRPLTEEGRSGDTN